MARPPERETRLVVEASEAGQRLDVFLARQMPDLSRAQIQRLIKAGQITASGKPAKVSAPVAAGAVIEVVVPPPQADTPLAEALPLSILHDDADLVVIDKPAGMVVHPAPGHGSGTLVNALLHHIGGLSGIGGLTRPGIVHRLDRGTSGVMVVAKNDRSHQALSRQFHDRTVRKTYVALVWGRPAAGQTFEQALGRDPRDRQKISSRARKSRTAITTVDQVEPLGAVSLIQVTIGTGRTHQIRVHLSEAGHPIVGDELYGGVRKRLPSELGSVLRLSRPFLHSWRLTFAHPSGGESVRFEAPLPSDLQTTIDALRRVESSRVLARGSDPETP